VSCALLYINFTGNYGILDIETNYLQGASLEEGTDEKYATSVLHLLL